ncbi:MAG: hypothetical protein JO276_16710 [Sphingomonadaceae bacterium]|nr:hypothetical protein [Sphingomonadaceae bacterium]
MPRLSAGLAALAALAACVARTPPPAPQHPPLPPPPPAAAPAPAPPAPPVAWEDAALAAGDWSYGAAGGTAQAAFAGPDGPAFALRCAPGGRIALQRPGGGALTIVTSFGARSLAAAGGQAELSAADPLFDQIAFSRGRFLVRAAGAADLVLPTWAEPERLIEECRS